MIVFLPHFEQAEGMNRIRRIGSDGNRLLQELLRLIVPLLTSIQVSKIHHPRDKFGVKAQRSLQFGFSIRAAAHLRVNQRQVR